MYPAPAPNYGDLSASETERFGHTRGSFSSAQDAFGYDDPMMYEDRSGSSGESATDSLYGSHHRPRGTPPPQQSTKLQRKHELLELSQSLYRVALRRYSTSKTSVEFNGDLSRSLTMSHLSRSVGSVASSMRNASYSEGRGRKPPKRAPAPAPSVAQSRDDLGMSMRAGGHQRAPNGDEGPPRGTTGGPPVYYTDMIRGDDTRGGAAPDEETNSLRRSRTVGEEWQGGVRASVQRSNPQDGSTNPNFDAEGGGGFVGPSLKPSSADLFSTADPHRGDPADPSSLTSSPPVPRASSNSRALATLPPPPQQTSTLNGTGFDDDVHSLVGDLSQSFLLGEPRKRSSAAEVQIKKELQQLQLQHSVLIERKTEITMTWLAQCDELRELFFQVLNKMVVPNPGSISTGAASTTNVSERPLFSRADREFFSRGQTEIFHGMVFKFFYERIVWTTSISEAHSHSSFWTGGRRRR